MDELGGSLASEGATMKRGTRVAFGAVMAVCAFLPAAAVAQDAPARTGPDALGAAVAEARQTPFHAAAASRVHAVLTAPATRFPYSGGPQAPNPAPGSSFQRVWWPTLGTTAASWVAFLGMTRACALIDLNEDGRCPGDSNVNRVTKVAAVGLLPPVAARLAGASFPKALLGSLAGAAAGIGVGVIGLWPVLPVVQAALTTAIGRM